MADDKDEEKILLGIDLNTDGAQSGVKALAKSFDQLNDELNHWKDLQKSSMNPADVAKYNQEIAKVKAEMKALNSAGVENVNTVKGFKQQLKEATQNVRDLALAGKKNTEEYREAVKVLAQLRDTSDEVNRDLLANDPGNRFKALASGAALLGQGYQGVTGALSLMGIEAGNAEQIQAKLMAIQSVVQAVDAYGDFVDIFKAAKLAIFGASEAKIADTVATNTQTTAQAANTVATNTGTIAAKGFRVALMAIPFIAVASFIAYVVTNFDSLKRSVVGLFPEMEKSGETFNKVKNIAVGFGNVIIQWIINPYKALFKLLKGDFKGAMADIEKMFSIGENFKEGQLQGELSDQRKANKVKLEKDIEYAENKLKVLKASGANTDKYERDLLNKKLQLYKDDETKFKELTNEKAVFEATIRKKNADEADKVRKEQQAKAKAAADKEKADRLTLEKEFKKSNEDALKVLEKSTLSERDKAIADIRFRYKTQLDTAVKLKQDTVNLKKAEEAEIADINKKYNDEVSAYISSKDAEKLNAFDKQRKAINDEIDKLKKNATPESLAALEASKANQLGKVDSLESLTNASKDANSNLDSTELNNAENDSDPIETARQKVLNIANAKIEAENAAYLLSKLQLEGQQSEIEALEEAHNNRLLGIETSTSKAKLALDKAEKEAKIANMQTVGGALGGLSQLLGENTMIGKGISIAQATMDTYAGASKALAQGGIFGYIGAAGVIAAGIANVKKIISVKVPNATASSSVAGASAAISSYQAPIINSTILKQNENGVANLNNTVASKNNEPIQAFIVDRDLNKQKDNSALYNRLSSI
jgi:hypothetical protein